MDQYPYTTPELELDIDPASVGPKKSPEQTVPREFAISLFIYLQILN